MRRCIRLICTCNLHALHKASIIFLCLLLISPGSYAQQRSRKYIIDSILLRTLSLRSRQPDFNYIYHFPEEEDRHRYISSKSLIKQQPNKRNYEQYYLLARSLWHLKKITDAEQMFLTIINAKELFYTSTYMHSSDIPGDTTRNIYGYGSCTSNYKNYAAIYLTKIYLEQKKFDQALRFLETAVKVYKTSYSCGTGFHMQQDEYTFLYATCYKGLNRNREVIDLLLPSCLTRNDTIIIAAIRASYQPQEIKDYISKAETSITCSVNSFPSYTYRTAYSNNKKGKTDTLKYFSGVATIMLFNRNIAMPSPQLEDGERMTQEHFLRLFEESDFYIRLTEAI